MAIDLSHRGSENFTLYTLHHSLGILVPIQISCILVMLDLEAQLLPAYPTLRRSSTVEPQVIASTKSDVSSNNDQKIGYCYGSQERTSQFCQQLEIRASLNTAYPRTFCRNRSATAPFRCLTAMPPEGSTRAGILPGYPILDRGSRDTEVGSEKRTFPAPSLITGLGKVSSARQTVFRKRKRSAVTLFRCLAAMPSEGSTRTGILPDCPSLDRRSRDEEIVFEPQTFWMLEINLQTPMSAFSVCNLKQAKQQAVLALTMDWLDTCVLCVRNRNTKRKHSSRASCPPLPIRFGLCTPGDPESTAVECAGILNQWGEGYLLDWVAIDNRLCTVRLEKPVKKSHNREVDHCLLRPQPTVVLTPLRATFMTSIESEREVSWTRKAKEIEEAQKVGIITIIIVDNMTSVINTDASLTYNHDFFESLIVKKRIKMDGEWTWCCLTTINPRCQVKVSAHTEREAWWTPKANEMEQPQKTGKARRLFQMIRVTNHQKRSMSETVEDQSGATIVNKGHLDHWTKH
ncbi:ATP-binding cassette transporter [Clonorchis sinensis]|uniref:ATP-binding cassette transporter n=1 Tax=Clonorchis sinensis TaxID=79923 RepID=G7YFI8_CLOSI|nr:ATP-binding cassette transporter [Clonorchis sinensis]